MGFFSLSAGRQFNETGVQPLTFAEITSFLNERRIFDLDERRECERYLRALDSKFMVLSHEKMARERERLMSKNSSGKVGSKGR